MKNILTFLAFIFLVFNLSFAQGTDNAADPAYNSGWTSTTNGGTGFLTWNLLTGGGTSGHFIDNGSFNNNILSSDKSWGMYAEEGGLSESIRPFSTTPSSNDRISIKMDNNWVVNSKTVGIGIRNSSNENLMEFYFVGGGSDYTLSDNAGTSSTGVSYTDTGLLIEIEITSATTFDLKITELHTSAVTTLSNRNFSNPSNGQTIDHIRLFNAGAGPGTNYNLYFNDLSHEVGVLPIELANFEAFKRVRDVELNWTTLSEENNKGFYIERSDNRTDFNPLDFIEGNENSTHEINYSFIDSSPLGGINYYRLKQIDFDGTFEYSDVVSIDFATLPNTIIFPNPVSDKITIQTDYSGVVSIQVLDLNGRVMYNSNQQLDSQAELDLDFLPEGSYFLQILDSSNQTILSNKSFVKQ